MQLWNQSGKDCNCLPAAHVVITHAGLALLKATVQATKVILGLNTEKV